MKNRSDIGLRSIRISGIGEENRILRSMSIWNRVLVTVVCVNNGYY